VIEDLATHTIVLARCLTTAVRARLHRAGARAEDGMGTLEIVVIALGLMTVAALLVAAITAAVTRRTDLIK
jgi:hypothetical protein